MHDYHEALPGFSEAQILHDGCKECESRAESTSLGLATLDKQNFARAWQRAAQWNRQGLPDVSYAERPMLNMLWAVQIQLENFGNDIGRVPFGAFE
jgi:hypothetical protein